MMAAQLLALMRMPSEVQEEFDIKVLSMFRDSEQVANEMTRRTLAAIDRD